MSEAHSHIVVRTSAGTVSYCAECGKIHIRYGPTLLRLNQKRFEQLRQFVQQSFNRHFESEERASQSSLKPEAEARELQLRFSDISLCFDHSEAQAFLDLLEEAWLSIQRSRLEKMLQL